MYGNVSSGVSVVFIKIVSRVSLCAFISLKYLDMLLICTGSVWMCIRSLADSLPNSVLGWECKSCYGLDSALVEN